MLLVDPRQMDLLHRSHQPIPNPTVDSLRNLDEEMRNILEDRYMDTTNKVKRYQQTLHKYLSRVEQYKDQPLGVVRDASLPEEG